MSIYDKSSLVLIPSGTKTGKVFSQKPVSGDGDFTFTRASAATRVNADGNIEKETQNLLLHSNTFTDSSWIHGSITLTSGQSGYDGGSNAWKLDKSATSYTSVYQDVSQSGVQTISIYVKEGTLNTGALYADGGTADYSVFDLTNGNNSTNTSGVIDAGSTNEGNGWYRLYMVVNKSVTRVRFYPDWSNSTAGNVYVQDFQLNQGLIPQEVITTTTAAVYGGITDNTPRLDYTDSSCPSLLLEPQRTNLVTQSEYFGAWTNTNLSIDSDFYNSPEGIANANFAIPTTASGLHKLRVDLSSVTGLYTQSIYAKQGGYKNLLVWDDSTSGGIGVNLDDLSIFRNQNNSGYDVQEVGNGWVRISVTQNYSAQIMRPSLYIYDNSATPAISFAGDGTSGIYIYGAQLEAGTYATSYIPTYGSSVTRVAESNSVTGVSDLIGQTEGTMYVEFEHNIVSTTEDTRFILSDNSYNNWIFFSIENGTSLRYYITSGGVNELDATATNVFPSVGRYKVALAYEDDLLTIYVNGVQKVNNTTSTNIPAMSAFLLSGKEAVTSAVELVDKQIHQALLFKTRLTNEELADLTTL